MNISIEQFSNAYNWLISQGKVHDQMELSDVTGITETTISRILNRRVKKVSSGTAEKLMNAFPEVFTYEWIVTGKIGEANPTYPSPTPSASESQPTFIPSWADSLIQIISYQIKENEALNRELRQSLNHVTTLAASLEKLLSTLSHP